MVEGALSRESGGRSPGWRGRPEEFRALGRRPGSHTDFFGQIHETGGLEVGGLMPFPTLKFDGSGKVVPPPDRGWSLSSHQLSGAKAVTPPMSFCRMLSPRLLRFQNHGFYGCEDPHCMARWPSGHRARRPSFKLGQAQATGQCGGKRNMSSEGQTRGWGHSWSSW